VAATPWAEVAVDGVHVEVTPFARSIPLAPGTHYVTLTHPESPPEKRIVEVTEGATILVEATMSVDAGTEGGRSAPSAKTTDVEPPPEGSARSGARGGP
jgi:serine/threonine-protein kinase